MSNSNQKIIDILLQAYLTLDDHRTYTVKDWTIENDEIIAMCKKIEEFDKKEQLGIIYEIKKEDHNE